MKPYYCPKCRRNHRWDSEVGAKHRNHSVVLYEIEHDGMILREILCDHYYNPLSIQYRQWFLIADGKRLIYRGIVEEEWLTWDGEDVQGLPEDSLGYPRMRVR